MASGATQMVAYAGVGAGTGEVALLGTAGVISDVGGTALLGTAVGGAAAVASLPVFAGGYWAGSLVSPWVRQHWIDPLYGY